MSAIRATGIYTLNIALKDERYVLPTRAQVNDEFADEFRARLPEMGLREYVPESGDCDDYGLEAWNLMRRFWRKTPGAVRAGIAFGPLDFLRRDGIAHEIDFYITLENGKLLCVPWEPQTQTDQQLNREEFESCDYLAC